MYHSGHQGVALLVYAPIGYVLLSGGYPLFALLGFVLMIGLASFPDIDMRFRFISHRGFTHTFLFAILVGGVLAALSFIFGDSVVVPGVNWLSDLQSLPQEIATPLADNSAAITQRYGGGPLAVFVFFIGVLGICSHLIGDILTPMGIEPLWPISDANFSLNVTPAKSTLANSVLFLIGWGAVIAAGVLATGVLGSGVA